MRNLEQARKKVNRIANFAGVRLKLIERNLHALAHMNPLLSQSPDIKRYLNIALPSQPTIALAQAPLDQTDNVQVETTRLLDAERIDVANNIMLEAALESQAFLPDDVELLPHEAQDVLKRLLTVNPKRRIHSVLALQKIALYKNFKIDMHHLLKLRPLDIIAKDNIVIYNNGDDSRHNSADATKAFQGF